MAVERLRLDRPPARRAVTIRLRTLVLLAGLTAAAVAVVAIGRYATGLQPLSHAGLFITPLSTAPLPHTADPHDTGAPVYRWRPGARVIYTTEIANTSELPVTITGVVGSPGHWSGAFSGPQPALGNIARPAAVRPFRPIELGPGERGALAFVFAADPRACTAAGGGTLTRREIVVRFRIAGLLDGTQVVRLPDDAAMVMRQPTLADCR